MSKLKKVWVLSDKPAALAELCHGGGILGEEVLAVVPGARESAEQAVKWGAGRVFWLQEAGRDETLEDYAPILAERIRQEQPELILIRANARGKLIAGRLAATLATNVLTDALSVAVADGQVIVEHRAYGGAAIRTEKCLSGTAIVTVGAGVFARAAEDHTRTGTIIEVGAVEPAGKIKCLERRKKEGEAVDLGSAKRVVGVGRGIAKQEDLRLAEELALALEAEVGCSRPIAEGENWMARERYLGVSGVMIKAELYLALGISGQVQHMVGVNSARTIIAVNKDKNAPIFKEADYGIVGDLYKVVPALTNLLKAAQ